MSGLGKWRLKNQMLIDNAISNIIGLLVVGLISQRNVSPPTPAALKVGSFVDCVYLPLIFIVIGWATYRYEQPIRRCLDALLEGRSPAEADLTSARRKLLNEPFVLMGMSLGAWLLAAVIYPFVFHLVVPGEISLYRVVLQTLLVGLITVIVAFFRLERSLQKRLAPRLFPDGGLYATPGTLPIRIRTRMLALCCAVNLIPFIAIATMNWGAGYSTEPPEVVLALLRSTIYLNTALFIALGLATTLLVSSNLTRPLEEIIRVLKTIRGGRLDRKVRVRTGDEIGYAGDVINEMTEGLREREHMRRSLALAREIQQSLLPVHAPVFESLDVAGRSLYCDQTGGDYFDYFPCGDHGRERTALVVGDVSGHGIPAALLMATARAFLRLRASLSGDIARVMDDVNRQLSRDVESSGQFMTLFLLMVDPDRQSLSWVRAGHEPAIFYDPACDAFRSLDGKGIALGLDASWRYEVNTLDGLCPGQILLLGTDGIWEARDPAGRMFGKKALYDIIRDRAAHGAEDILEAVLAELARFQEGAAPEDDITLVVAKPK
ncbi:MAG: SpoIIE family protein phosphatase [Desulfobacteraceae bacterium]|nr:SpoIIE family protein phosphatase [Desulfobacteraceae bacterium]